MHLRSAGPGSGVEGKGLTLETELGISPEVTLSERQGAECVAWEQAVAYHKGVCFCGRTGSVLDMQSEVFADLLGV